NHPCCLERSCSCHHHGEYAAVLVCRQHYGLIAGKVCLRRKDIQALCASDAWSGLERERRETGLCECGQTFLIEWVEHAHQDGAAFHMTKFIRRRCAHLQHQVG